MVAKVRFRVYSGLYNDFLNYICSIGIPVFDIKPQQLGFTAVCYASDYRDITAARKKFQVKIKIIRKYGLWFCLRKLLARKGVIAGAIIFMLLSYLLSLLVWYIDIHTDDVRLKNQIAIQLFENGIYPGAYPSKEKLETAEKAILAVNSKIKYISLNFYKGMLDCEIQLSNPKQEYLSQMGIEDIYAQLSGIISDLRVYEGFSLVELGQSVSAGEKLVSSTYTDKHGNSYISETRAYVEAVCDKTYGIEILFDKTTEFLTGEKYTERTFYFMNKKFSSENKEKYNCENSAEKSEIEYFSVMGFHLPVTVKTTDYYSIDSFNIITDSLTARKKAQRQLEYMISYDTKLKKEIMRQYEYTLTDEGLTVYCHIKGYYDIT